MRLPKSEHDRAENRSLSDLLGRMAEYVRHQTAEGEVFVIPKLAAAALRLNEGEAFVLLKMMADAGQLKQQYNVYCGPQGIYLQSVDTLDELDKIDHCDFCDKQHEPHEYSVEIAFRPSSGKGANSLAA